jgi:SAM-dependent methyltransferase
VTSLSDTHLRIAGYSALILFFELALIRYTAGYVRVFSFYLNFVLIATFLGMGVGLLRAERASRLKWLAVPATIALFAAVWYFARVPIAVPADPDEFVWAIFSSEGRRVPLWLVVATLFTLTAFFFIPLGALLGEQFRKLPALTAYSMDIAGSLAGILVFGVLSAARQPPIVWFAIGFVVWLAMSFRDRRLAVALVGAGAAAIGFAWAMRGSSTEHWSPYYRINVTRDGPALRLDVNGSLHQMVLDLDSASAQQFPYARVARAGYLLPYQWVDAPDTVLVVGAGTGNDLALLLRQGARYVDAVEIDPVIADVGRAVHPQKPYDDPRIHLHVDDARAFLRKAQRRYDLIIFGTLDSQTLLSGMSSVRLDNYVYTRESFAAARARLTPDGSLVVYHRSPEPYIGAKIHQMIGAAFDRPPGVFFGEMNLFNLVFVAGAGAPRVPAAPPSVRNDLGGAYAPAVDDWPYLYLRGKTVPGHYRVALLTALAIAAALVFAAAGRVVRRGFDAPMFLMGAGFLLVETKSVTEMSLLFGSTWNVNLLVFSSILVMVLLANLVVMRRAALELHPLFAALFATLAVAYLVPASSLLWLGTGGQWLLGGLMVAAPIFFAALIFSTLFRESTDPPRALAYNLLGAIVGGLLEYSSMAVGIKGLYLFAAGIYLLAWLSGAQRASAPSLPLNHSRD